MVLNYSFDDSTNFEYDVDLKNYVDSLPLAQKGILASELYSRLDDYDKEAYALIYPELKLPNALKAEVISPDAEECIEEIISNASDNEIYDIQDTEVLAYFRDEAEEAYKDAVAYNTDPYGYNGVKPSDFY